MAPRTLPSSSVAWTKQEISSAWILSLHEAISPSWSRLASLITLSALKVRAPEGSEP